MSTSSHIDISQQRLFFDYIDERMLYELIERITRGKLATHIKDDLSANNIHDISISAVVSRNPETEDISFYINFIRKSKSYAHISFHMTESIYKKRSHDPIHIKLNSYAYSQQAYLPIMPHMNTSTNSMVLTYTLQPTKKHSSIVKIARVYPEFKSAMHVLQRYFTKGDEYFLINTIARIRGNPRMLQPNTITTLNEYSNEIGAINLLTEQTNLPNHPLQITANILTRRKQKGHHIARMTHNNSHRMSYKRARNRHRRSNTRKKSN